jgi:hypothetical protein
MKTRKTFLLITIFFTGFQLIPATSVNAQGWLEIAKAAAKKVIIAIDLQVQRIQNKTLDLQIAQKELDNVFSKLKLDEISDWTNKQKEIYQEYFDELWRVKSIITYYKRITDIIAAQKQLVNEYKSAYSLFQQDNHFSAGEISYMYKVYSGIIDASINSLDQILNLLESFTVQMSDGERLDLLNKSATEINQNISDLRAFNNQNIQLSLQRTKDQKDLDFVKQLYGL